MGGMSDHMLDRLVETAHEVVRRYYIEHPKGPLASLIGDLDIAATTFETDRASEREQEG